MSFLTAEWNDLALINYEINPKILEKYVPKGTELDLWNGKCYISLIGFMFENVKVLGFKIPFHINFEEVNLRFYVKRFENGIWKRGTVFIKEIVPKPAVTLVANILYKEHYQTLKMRHSRTENEVSKTFQYEWEKDNKWNSIAMTTNKIALPIELNSEAEFITEHYFGYTKFNENKTIEYEVTHPRWQQLEVLNYTIDVDFESIYGNDFAFLQDLKPTSTFLALGSKITIEGKKTIK
ncbi:YqjF family protein [Flavobacterium sp.]|uniref:YqjF family protein n=1 Tax=Flavobacterium sp. TaxID=239 RepID=UPI00375079E8